MSAAEPYGEGSGRLLTFEVGGLRYALPIASVSEVTEPDRIAAVPTVSSQVAGVMNHHGDALPVVKRGALLPDGAPTGAPRQLLVLAEDPEDPRRYGLPVDAVGGLIDGPAPLALGDDPVAERRPQEGRLLHILDPARLRARAVHLIEQSAGIRVPSGTSSEGRP